MLQNQQQLITQNNNDRYRPPTG